MKKIAFLCVLLVSLAATASFAAEGVNLRWQDCFGDGGTLNRNFACDTNGPPAHVLVGSFELGADMVDVSGNEITITLISGAPTLPPWWQFRNVGTCRQTSLLLNTAISPLAVNCQDWAGGQSVGGLAAYNIGVIGPSSARILAAAAVPPSSLAALGAGQEYFSFNLVVNNAKTVGDPSCAGCSVPVCIVFHALKLTTPVAVNDRFISGATNLTDSFFATWQGGTFLPPGKGCPWPVPTRRSTWSGLKSLYR